MVAAILLGIGILALATATTWHGLRYQNPHYGTPPEQIDWAIFNGMLLAAAPAVVLGWRTGRTAPQPRYIWLSAFLGVWLPLVLSVTVASLADQAGANLFWVPSLFRGFNWRSQAFQKSSCRLYWSC